MQCYFIIWPVIIEVSYDDEKYFDESLEKEKEARHPISRESDIE